MAKPMDDLTALSREYGSDPKWVVAGGGNTSLKEGNTLYVKASGFPLATIGEEGFARMDRSKLAAIWNADYPDGADAASVAERERMVLADTMSARLPGEERRPSVETLLHDILPWTLVVHLHPTLVNGLTCGADGRRTAEELFGEDQVWIPCTDPGYVLATVIRKALDGRARKGLGAPEYIFLENHGVFAGGKDAEEVRGRYSKLHEALSAGIAREPGPMPAEAAIPGDPAELDAAARALFGDGARTAFVTGGELDRYLASAEAAAPLTGCLTPDHIVYAGPGALYLDGAAADGAADPGIAGAWKAGAEEYAKDWGKPPNVTLFGKGPAKGALVAAAGEKALANAVLLLENALEVCAYAESFGGPSLMEERFVRFIVDWEVENYRSKMASA